MINVQTKALLRAIAVASSVVERRNAVPVLGELRARANGVLTIAGTDLDMAAEASVAYSGDEAAPFLLGDHRFLRHAVGHAGVGSVGLTPSETGIAVEAGELSMANNSTAAVDDWPVLASMGDVETSGTLGRRELALLARIARAMSVEETRYYLNGVYFHEVDDWTIRAVATDGHRLMWADLRMPDKVGAMKAGLIVPRKMINLLLTQMRSADTIALRMGRAAIANQAAPAEGTAPLSQGAPIVEVTTVMGGMTVHCRSKTIDGKYPDYARVIPSEVSYAVTVDAAALRRAIGALAFGPTNITPALKLSIAKGKLEISAAYLAQAEGRAAMTIAAEGNAPAGFSIGFNGRYLRDVIDTLKGEKIVLGLGDGGAPATINDPAETGFGAVLMPMRV
jgi:DNA polymerase-3 subunit beta